MADTNTTQGAAPAAPKTPEAPKAAEAPAKAAEAAAPAPAEVAEAPAEAEAPKTDGVTVLMVRGKYRRIEEGRWVVYKTGQQLTVPRQVYDRFRDQMELVK